MNSEYLIDSYAWIEYYDGTEEGLKVKEIIENNKISTPILVFSELSNKFHREGKDFTPLFDFIISKSKILHLQVDVALEAGRFKTKMRKKYKQFSLADSISYLMAKHYDYKLVTGDHHLKGLDNVEFIG